MFKKILVAADASVYSRHALSFAVKLAKLFHSEIEIIHVFELPMAYSRTEGTNPYKLEKDKSLFSAGTEGVTKSRTENLAEYTISEEQIKNLSNAAVEATMEGVDCGQVPVKKKTVRGYPATAILKEIESDKDIGLVIMGSRGHSPMAGAILGSVTQRVLAEATCPVIVVK